MFFGKFVRQSQEGRHEDLLEGVIHLRDGRRDLLQKRIHSDGQKNGLFLPSRFDGFQQRAHRQRRNRAVSITHQVLQISITTLDGRWMLRGNLRPHRPPPKHHSAAAPPRTSWPTATTRDTPEAS